MFLSNEMKCFLQYRRRKPDFEFLNAGGVFTDTVSEPFVWVAKSRKRRRRKRGKRAGVLIRLRRRAFRPSSSNHFTGQRSVTG